MQPTNHPNWIPQIMESIVYFTPNFTTATATLTQSNQQTPDLATQTIKLIPKSAVEVLGDIVNIDQTLIMQGQAVEYNFKGKKYFAHKPKQGVIDIYEVK